jgi:hypothetical protein
MRWFGQSTLEDRNLWPDCVVVIRPHFRSMADGTPIHASNPTLLGLGVLNRATHLQIVGVPFRIGVI